MLGRTIRANVAFLVAAVLVLRLGVLFAQSQTQSVRWSGQIRMRSEVDGRDFNQETPPNTFTLLRSRLGAEIVPVENVKVFLQVQDSRVFGEEKTASGSFSTLAGTSNLDLHQGYVEINEFLAEPLSVKIGRQELKYGNERIIGAVGWHNVGRSFDGVLLRLGLKAALIDFFAMKTGETAIYPPVATPTSTAHVRNAGSELFGIYGTFESLIADASALYLLFEWNRNQTVAGLNDLERFTIGSYAKGKIDLVDFVADFAYQGGKRQGTDVSAYMLTGAVGYSFSEVPLRRLSVGYELLSGTSPTNSEYQSFDPAFHTGHKFYGFMDYFISIPDNTETRGLSDLVLHAFFKVSEPIDFKAWFHNIRQDEMSTGKKALGQEIDLIVSYSYTDRVVFSLGASTFLPASQMRRRFRGSDAAFWSFLSAEVSF